MVPQLYLYRSASSLFKSQLEDKESVYTGGTLVLGSQRRQVTALKHES